MINMNNTEDMNNEICGVIYINKVHYLKLKCTQCIYVTDNFENFAIHLTDHYKEIRIGVLPEDNDFQEENDHCLNAIETTQLIEDEIEEQCTLSKEADENLMQETIAATYIEHEQIFGNEDKFTVYEETCQEPFENLNIEEQKDNQPQEEIDLGIQQIKISKNKGRPSSRRWSNEFQCKVCGSSFKDKYVLAKHTLRHTGKKDFSCSQCSKKFYTRTEVKLHERRHNNERPYLCIFCGKTFVTTSNLDEHIKRHASIRPHKCHVCGKGFHDKGELIHHLPVHSDVRAFACDKCPGTFKQQKSLQAHMKIHENKRQYRCTLCGASFNQGPALKSHQRSKHRNKIQSNPTNNDA